MRVCRMFCLCICPCQLFHASGQRPHGCLLSHRQLTSCTMSASSCVGSRCREPNIRAVVVPLEIRRCTSCMYCTFACFRSCTCLHVSKRDRALMTFCWGLHWQGGMKGQRLRAGIPATGKPDDAKGHPEVELTGYLHLGFCGEGVVIQPLHERPVRGSSSIGVLHANGSQLNCCHACLLARSDAFKPKNQVTSHAMMCQSHYRWKASSMSWQAGTLPVERAHGCQ